MPKVSVVMPVFNKSDFLQEAINSVLNQTFDDFELIIIDDGSTDNSVKIIQGYSDQRIQYIANSLNIGQADTLNKGIEKAQGEYITFAHGDDVWMQNFLSTHVALMDEFSTINISYALAHYINNDGEISLSSRQKNKSKFQIINSREVVKNLLKSCYITTPTVFLRNGSFPNFNKRYYFACDYDLWIRIAEKGNDFLFINEPLIYYRQHTNNVTSVSMREGIGIIDEYNLLRNFFKRNSEFNAYKAKTLRRLSMSILRRSRNIDDKESILFYHKFAALVNPLNLFNPVFYMYLLTGYFLGHSGLSTLKRITKTFSYLFKKFKKQMNER